MTAILLSPLTYPRWENTSIRSVSNVEAEKEEQPKANSHRADVVKAVQERRQLSHWTAEYLQS